MLRLFSGRMIVERITEQVARKKGVLVERSSWRDLMQQCNSRSEEVLRETTIGASTASVSLL